MGSCYTYFVGNNKKIVFTAFGSHIKNTEPAPEPASNKIPKWYRDLPHTYDGFEIKEMPGMSWSKNRGTAKRCIPFLESFTTGYIISLPQDIEIVSSEDQQGIDIFWGVNRPSGTFIDTDAQFRHGGFIPEDGYHNTLYRLHTEYEIKTQEGYSILLTHPLNRLDLPFTTISGIIDTDNFSTPIVVTFAIKKGFSGIIEKGTPMAQIIPIKQDNWSSSIGEPYTEEQRYSRLHAVRSKINRGYQSIFWKKKIYK